jgi:hypothetical protein
MAPAVIQEMLLFKVIIEIQEVRLQTLGITQCLYLGFEDPSHYTILSIKIS